MTDLEVLFSYTILFTTVSDMDWSDAEAWLSAHPAVETGFIDGCVVWGVVVMRMSSWQTGCGRTLTAALTTDVAHGRHHTAH